ncbi:family 43 glycosylhydrolase [Anaerocolumna chitinilytica]|uniref:Beta-xylosidase n=1 Tax=Anaerocolumna chitinilytica TaxID=1727145 RepID=A0A7I8DG77_9FIRM|nr:family 43 glycosylhydrolase [Anaerocolumna chitinilytica]BCJ97523.1 hypothetical protein bsdcttw_05640 [Anaerocolumna chitinilytica]
MRTYKNPFLLEHQWSENECGDPFIMRFNGYYYLYCSSAGNHIKAWKSENLVDFDYLGSVCDAPEIDGAYAPEVSYCNGKFYMVTSPVGSGHYLLEGDRPEGPFHLISKNYGLMIDGSFFTDDDGKRYLLRAGHKGIVIHDMPQADTIEVNGKIIPESYLNYWTEGPMIIKRKGLYYLTYTGNHLLSKGYRVAYSISEKGPDSGYVNLSDNTLLLETGEEFHALGHSSSFLAPDLDSYCIAYHNIDLNMKPRKRSMNIDRLFFNGARMYCNPIWWEQEVPAMPDCYGWGEGNFQQADIKDKKYLISKAATSKAYTAELSVNTKGGNLTLLYGYGENTWGEIELCCDRSYKIIEGDLTVSEGRINNTVSFLNYMTVRLARTSDSLLEIYLNNMLLASFVTVTGEGKLGIAAEAKGEVGFFGISRTIDGNGDKIAAKAIPGRMDAIHGTGGFLGYPLKESGFLVKAAAFEKGKKVLYHVNIKEDGYYQVIVRASAGKKDHCLVISSENMAEPLRFHLTGISDENGFEKIKAGVLWLTRGIKDIAVSSEEEMLIDYFLFRKAAEVMDIDVVKKGQLVTEDIKIFGHKQLKSMITKYSGFTCAENFGRAFVGEEGFNDYTISTVIYRNNAPTGDASIYIRASKESWFPDQVTSSLFGYRISVKQEGIYLYRCCYGEEQLGFYRLPCKSPGTLALSVRAEGTTLAIVLEDRVILTFTDTAGYLYGKAGLEATGEGFAFEEYRIRRDLSL